MSNFRNSITKSLIAFLLLLTQPAIAGKCGNATRCGKLVASARAVYNEHKHQEALSQFQAAYDMSKSPILLVFIGCAMHGLGRYDDAIGKFRTFLKQRPQSLHATKVRDYLARSKSQRNAPAGAQKQELVILPSAASPSMAVPYSPPLDLSIPFVEPPIAVMHAAIDKTSSARSHRLMVATGALTVGLGLVGIIAGVGCYGTLVSLQDKFHASADEFDKQNMLTQAGHLGRASTASYIAGGLLLGTGISLFVTLGVKRHPKRNASSPQFHVATQVVPGYIGSSLRGTF